MTDIRKLLYQLRAQCVRGPNIARNEVNREQHEYELAASHARGEAEDRHNKRMRLMREIEKGMKEVVRPIIKGERNEFNS